MPGLLDFITQAAELPTTLAQNNLQYQQAQAMLKQYPQYAKTLQNINSYMNGGDQAQASGGQTQQQPQQAPQQAPAGGLLSLLNGATGMINAAHPSGGLLSAPDPQQPTAGLFGPQTTQSPTGPVTTTPLPNNQAQPAGQQQSQQPQQLQQTLNDLQQQSQQQSQLTKQKIATADQQAAALQQQQAAAGQQTTQPSGPDNWKLYQAGVQLQSLPFPQAQAYGQALTKYAAARIANDPANATRMAVAKDDLTVDQQGIQQAQASGDPMAIQAAQMKYLTDSKLVNPAAYNGNVTTFGGLTPQQLGMSTFSPSTGIQTQGGQSSLMPGYAGAVAQRAAAQAGGAGAGQAPYDLVPVVGPDKQTYMVPKSVLLNGGARNGTSGTAAGASAPGSAPAGFAPTGAVGVARQSPEQSSQQTAAGTGAGEELTELNKQADSARQANYTLDQLRRLGQGVSLGPAAPAREWFEQVATPLAQAFGMQPPKELANYQQINKFGNTLAFNAARAMGSREAAQIVQLQVQSNPQKGLVSDAYNGLIDSMSALNRYVLAKNAAIQGAATGGQITARQATANWETGVDPTVWDLAISPQLASRFSGQIGADKISKAVPFMASDDAISTMRNISRPLQAQVLRALPPAAKQEILMGLQSSVQQGATGTF